MQSYEELTRNNDSHTSPSSRERVKLSEGEETAITLETVVLLSVVKTVLKV